LVLACVLLTYLIACATPKELEKYPVRHIDRPYTLPERLMSWKTLFTGTTDRTDSKGYSPQYQYLPFNWEQGLTDNLTLIWTPLPYQVRWQVYRTPESFFGLYGNLIGRTWSRTDDFNWSPIVSGTYRRKLVEWFAFEGTLTIEPDVRRAATPSWTIGPEFGALFQVADPLMVGAHIAFLGEWSDPRARYLGTLPVNRFMEWRLLTPVTAEIHWNIIQRLQLEAQYQYLQSPVAGGYYSHNLYLGTTLFW